MLRPFIGADLHALHQMIRDTIDAAYSGIYPPRAVSFFREHHSLENIRKRAATGQIWVLASENDDVILATGALAGQEIRGVFVHPDHQGRGHGKTVMAQIEKTALENGVTEVRLNISLPSRGFYAGLGYDVLAERLIDVGEGQILKYWPGRKTLKDTRQRASSSVKKTDT